MSSNLVTNYVKAFLYIFALPLTVWLLLPRIPIIGSFVIANLLVISILLIIYILISTVFVIYLYLAPNAVCFIFALENIATLIQSGGKFVDVVYSSRDRKVTKNFDVILKPNQRQDWLQENLGGLTFFGVPPLRDVLFIDLRHNKLVEAPKEDTREIEYRIQKTVKRTSRIDLRTTNYSMFFGEMETKDRIQIYTIMTTTLRVSNIYTFLNNKDPYGRLEEFLWAAFRTFVRNYEADELIGNKNVENEKETKNENAMLGKKFFDYLADNHKEITNVKIEKTYEGEGKFIRIDNLGFEISNFAVLDINLKDRSAEEASQMLYLAEKKRQAVIIEAEAEAEKIRRLAEAQAEKINMVSKICKDNNIPPSLPVIAERMGPDQANYFYWHGDHDGRVLNGQKARILTDEQIRSALNTFLDSQTTSSKKREKQP